MNNPEIQNPDFEKIEGDYKVIPTSDEKPGAAIYDVEELTKKLKQHNESKGEGISIEQLGSSPDLDQHIQVPNPSGKSEILITDKQGLIKLLFERYGDKSTNEILAEFLGDDPESTRKIKEVISETDFSHFGLETINIKKALAQFQSSMPEGNYQIVKRFPSVSIPARFEGSEAEIAIIKSDKPGYPTFEVFRINWGPKWNNINTSQRRKLIDHIALQVDSPQKVSRVLDILKKDNNNISLELSPTKNTQSGELFGYVANENSKRIEITHSEEHPPAELEKH